VPLAGAAQRRHQVSDSPVVVIAAGGTGGHMFPARAFADVMVARGARILLVTDPRGKRYTEGFPAEDNLILPVTNADEGGLMGKVRAGLAVVQSLQRIGPVFRRLAPRAVVGFGGYPTFPALQAAPKDCAVVIHEQNAVLGRVNRLFQGKATRIASGFARLEGLEQTGKHVVTGNPVRAPIVEARALPYPDLSEGSFTVLVTGGSQGARVLGDAVPAAFAGLPEDLRQRVKVIHQVREEQCRQAREIYADAGIEAEVWPFFQDMAGRLAAAHLVIGRAGASTVSETAVVGRPAILIPLAIATNDHQTFNAKALEDALAADVIAEAALSVPRLTNLLVNRLTDPEGLRRRAAAARAVGKPDAAEALADLVFEALR
jgi:UDP-N-acetylglucosamine--N-acetylmuramyl-(pentapeptide) pyrophosphoryl-undecaprenol N-acetylglucosamine transferase